MIHLLSALMLFVQIELIFDPNGDGVSDGLMWNAPVVVYLQGKPIAYATTGRDSSIHLDLAPGLYTFRAWVKNGPVVTHSYWLCQKTADIEEDTGYSSVPCRSRYLNFLPSVGSG